MDTKFSEYANLHKKYETLYGNDKQKSKILEQGSFFKIFLKTQVLFFVYKVSK